MKSRTFWGALLFASSLWAYTSLNNEYTPFINVPFNLKLPENKAVENPLPNTIAVKVRGTGWQLFYLNFFNTSKRCDVDLTKEDIAGFEHRISRTDILKGIEDIFDVETVDVLPESVELKLGKVSTYKVPVNPTIMIKPKDGFIAMNEIELLPDSVEITGNERIVKEIKYWNTENINIEDLHESESIRVPLSDSLNSIVKLSRQTVNIKINVQQEADVTIYDIPVKVKGGRLPKNHRIEPKMISVIIRGGIDRISEITQEDIVGYVDYKDIINDSTGIVVPKIKALEDVSGIYPSPKYLYHIKRSTKF